MENISEISTSFDMNQVTSKINLAGSSNPPSNASLPSQNTKEESYKEEITNEDMGMTQFEMIKMVQNPENHKIISAMFKYLSTLAEGGVQFPSDLDANTITSMHLTNASPMSNVNQEMPHTTLAITPTSPNVNKWSAMFRELQKLHLVTNKEVAVNTTLDNSIPVKPSHLYIPLTFHNPTDSSSFHATPTCQSNIQTSLPQGEGGIFGTTGVGDPFSFRGSIPSLPPFPFTTT